MHKLLSSDVHNFLKNNSVAVLATSYLRLPYASAVYFVVDEKMNFYFVTKMNTDKYLNLKMNKNVAMVIGMGPKHMSVNVRGHASIIKDKKQKNKILSKIELSLKSKKIHELAFRKMTNLQTKKKDLDQEIVYKVTPQHLIFINIDDPEYPNSISNKHHVIIPIPKK